MLSETGIRQKVLEPSGFFLFLKLEALYLVALKGRRWDRALIDALEGVRVIAETGAGDDVVRLIKELRPDLVLLDMPMPGMNEFEALEEGARQFPEVRVIIPAVRETGESAIRAFRGGAADYLSKSATRTDLQTRL